MSDLRAGSFVDDGVQYGRRKGHVSLGVENDSGDDEDMELLFENFKHFGEVTDVFSTPTAIHGRNIAHAVAALPKTYPGRAFLLIWADRGYGPKVAHEVGVSNWYARKTVERFLRRMGMKCV